MTGNERGTDSTGEAPSGRDPERGGGKPGRAISVSGLLMPIATVVLAAAIVGVLVGAIIDGGAVGATALAAAKDVAATYVRAPVLLLVSALLPLCLWAAVASSGRERIGGPDALPPVPVWAWACLVFCTGAAAGLVVWGVAEPLGHFRGNPHLPREQAETAAAIGPALRLTLFHWGLHPWAILTAAGLAVAIGATRSGIGTRPAAGLWPLAPRLAAGPADRKSVV